MRYIIDQICEIIASKTPNPTSETIILVNGFEKLKYYVSLAERVDNQLKDNAYKVNIKLAKKKWDKLVSSAASEDILTMRQHDWVADKESVTYYRNQHCHNVLVLLGTEDEEDTGGLANCFQITPDTITSALDGEYHKVFKSCFNEVLTKEDEGCIDGAYKALFEYIPVDICKLSDLADDWNHLFTTIEEFCEEFGKTLNLWGMPNRVDMPLKMSEVTKKKNFLRDEREFITGKFFQKLSKKKYVGLREKISAYAESGKYAVGTNWAAYGFTDYNEFSDVLLEFAREENVAANKERLLKMDYSIINDILKLKISDPKIGKVTEKSITGDPLCVVLNTLLAALRDAKDRKDAAEIKFVFDSASIVTGYTDADDDEKQRLLVKAWKNVCVHTNGVFDFINKDEWKIFGRTVKISCGTVNFFDPCKVYDNISSYVTVATGTNTLNKVMFYVTLYGYDGKPLRSDKDDEEKLMRKHYAWKFSADAPWLFDFNNIVFDDSLTNAGANCVPIGVMNHARNATAIRSEDEFFDLYGEESVDFSNDLTELMGSRLKGAEYDLKLKFDEPFRILGERFCELSREISQNGFYKCMCGDKVTEFYKQYILIADNILKHSFCENEEWIKDVFLQAFTILDSADYIENETDPDSVIIPPWHPSAIQKIADQKRFLIDGISQKIADIDEAKKNNISEDILDHFTRMSEIQSTIDVFPAKGNDYMGVLGVFGDFCVYGNEKNITSVRTHLKDVLRKDAIYDEEFKTAELTRVNDDARMFFDVLRSYVGAMPSAEYSLNVVFVNPPELQPIISAVSKYVRDIREKNADIAINMKIYILVRPENKGGKNYLTYWMDEYFSEDKNTSIRIYMNEWSSAVELAKLMPDDSDIVFNMDLLHTESFNFIPNSSKSTSAVTDCRFPIVYKPSPMSKTSMKRKIELTQTQFSVSYKYSQVVRYKKNHDTIPQGEYLAVRETEVDDTTKKIIDMLHKKAYWVVCIDRVMDGALLRWKNENNQYDIIGFSTGKGMYGQYNLTITARNSIIKTVEKKMRDRLRQLFKWSDEEIDKATKTVMGEARGLDGISMLSAISQRGTKIHEFMAYVLTSLRERNNSSKSALRIIIHLDSYKHWFDNSRTDDDSKRPDFLLLSVEDTDNDKLKLKAEILECKIARSSNSSQHIDKGVTQAEHGIEQLQRLFDPESKSIERRYWYAQLYRALVFAQVTFADNTNAFFDLSGKLREILDGNFEITWNGRVLGYWVDMQGDQEVVKNIHGIDVYNIPQKCIQKLLLVSDNPSFIEIDNDTLDLIDDEKEIKQEEEAEEKIKQERKNIFDRREPKTSILREKNKEARTSLEQSEDINTLTSLEEKNEFVACTSEQGDVIPTKEVEAAVDDAVVISTDRNIEDIRVLIGKDRGQSDVYWEFGNKELANRHLLITGTSGQGKTYSIQTMLYELSKSNVSSVIFDYTEGFRPEQLEGNFVDKMGDHIHQRVCKFQKVPINPFKRQYVEFSGDKYPEKDADIAARFANIITHVYKFGEQQFAAIFEAVRIGLSKYKDGMNMTRFQEELENGKQANKAAQTVISKMQPFFYTVEFEEESDFDWGNILYTTESNATIFQLTGMDREMQVIVTELMLWDLWHYSTKNGSKERPFVVVLDEAQNLSHKANSPSCKILTEGRKFGWSAWYATQSLQVLSDDEVTRLLQSAVKMYFKPTDIEMVKMAKQLDPTDGNAWLGPLKALKKGECIVVGPRIQRDGSFRVGRPTVTNVTSFEER